MDSEILDIWFTQDAVDADNLPAARLMAKYALMMLDSFHEINVWIDVSTAQRSLGRPRLKKYFDEEGNHVEEILCGTDKGFMGNEREHANVTEVLEDSLLCQKYDAALLYHVVHNTLKDYSKQIKVNVLIGRNGITKQVLWEPLVPNTFLFVDLKHSVARSFANVRKIENDLENVFELEKAYTCESSSKQENQKIKIMVKYSKNKDLGFDERRQKFREFIEKQIDSSKLFKNKETGEIYTQIEDVVKDLNVRDSTIHILIFAPVSNCSYLVQNVEKRRIKKVVGQILSFEKGDNLVGTQWNQYLDEHASNTLLQELKCVPPSCEIFFMPTQCFKRSINEDFKEQVHLKNLAKDVNKLVINSGCSKNILHGFQKLWNILNSKEVMDRLDLHLVQGQAVFDPVAMCYLLDKTLFKSLRRCKISMVKGRAIPKFDCSGNIYVPNIFEETAIDSRIKSYILDSYSFGKHVKNEKTQLLKIFFSSVIVFYLGIFYVLLATDVIFRMY